MPSEPDSLAPSFSFCSCFWFYCLSMFENLLGRFDQEIVPKGTDNRVSVQCHAAEGAGTF
jgi:hypothetical protein